MSAGIRNIYTIPSGIPFARTLARSLLTENRSPEKLSDIRIFLPTRRACRVLREAFLRESEGRPLVLPHIQPLGDIDEEELSLSIAGREGLEKFLDLPPGMPPLRRQLLLAKLVAHAQPDRNFSQALELAGVLGRFMDQIYTENLDLGKIADIVPAAFARHWQITLQFLNIISTAWPEILREEGMIDGADRRNRLILALAGHWRAAPPATPVIAAGSTGSIPAVAELLSVIAGLPQGQVILPGLDKDMDQESWDALEDSHPQYGLRHLLESLKASRHHVKDWPVYTGHPVYKERLELVREIMRPVETTGTWTALAGQDDRRKTLARAFEGLTVLECETGREEAETIAVLMRETLEHPERTAALVTPDRLLARRITAACRRWGMTVDDSAGQTLDRTPPGTFLRLLLQACLTNLAPVALLALLKHPLCRAGMSVQAIRESVQALEITALRGPRPEPGFGGLYNRLEKTMNTGTAKALLETLEPAFRQITGLPSGLHDFSTLIKAHIAAAEALAAGPDISGPERLWAREEGKSAAEALSELMDHGRLLPGMTLQTYAGIIDHLFRTVTVRPAYGTHPRLMILGQLEARLLDADLVILGGLNEGTWPPDPGHDPWMSRPMRRQFGLPPRERLIGLAAHDFVQGFCAPRAVLTRARRVQGVPGVPARWLQRLHTVIRAARLEHIHLDNHPYREWISALDRHDGFRPWARPAPKPPVSKRPRRISATRIETWRSDPYAIYARYILDLGKLDPLEQDPDAATYGTILHNILERFVAAWPADLPDRAEEILAGLARDEIGKRHDDPDAWNFWQPRFAKLARHYIAHEKEWRRRARVLRTETRGEMILEAPAGPFTISAVADRIDSLENGAVVIDYKSADNSFTGSRIENGSLPQLPAEALILARGGFQNLEPMRISALGYWILTGGAEPVKVTFLDGELDDLMTRTETGLKNLIAAFDDPLTPYYSLPDPGNAPRFNDYELLARVREWAVLGDPAGEAS